MLDAADKAARKLRGEDQEDDVKAKKGAAKKSKTANEDANTDTQEAVGKVREQQLEAKPAESSGYETRVSRGRPSKS